MSKSVDELQSEREKRRNVPRIRPTGIVAPGPGQESVWGYPRPPRVGPVARRVRVEVEGVVLADTTRALRVCETSSPLGSPGMGNRASSRVNVRTSGFAVLLGGDSTCTCRAMKL